MARFTISHDFAQTSEKREDRESAESSISLDGKLIPRLVVQDRISGVVFKRFPPSIYTLLAKSIWTLDKCGVMVLDPIDPTSISNIQITVK